LPHINDAQLHVFVENGEQRENFEEKLGKKERQKRNGNSRSEEECYGRIECHKKGSCNDILGFGSISYFGFPIESNHLCTLKSKGEQLVEATVLNVPYML